MSFMPLFLASSLMKSDSEMCWNPFSFSISPIVSLPDAKCPVTPSIIMCLNCNSYL